MIDLNEHILQKQLEISADPERLRMGASPDMQVIHKPAAFLFLESPLCRGAVTRHHVMLLQPALPPRLVIFHRPAEA